MRKCEKCQLAANCYAMGRHSGDWGGWYCYAHVPYGFMITDEVKGEADGKGI